MIPLKDAQAEGFATSTRAELRKYAEDLGVENIPSNANAEALKKIVRAALGMATEDHAGPAPATFKPQVTSAGGADKIFPSYNLTPSGIWGGRRHRLSIPRPEGVKVGQAEGFAWNGKHTYYLPYDEVVDVPEPIYQLLITNKRRRPIQKTVNIPGGGTEVTTAWEFDSVAMNYLGVDKATENRAGSLMEWYQSRGSEFFDKLPMRSMQLIATKIEIPQAHVRGPGIPPVPFTEDEMRGRLKEFFFGYADAVAPANEKIAA
jgi:hypothetical protein